MIDTNIGFEGKTITIPVQIDIMQHIQNDRKNKSKHKNKIPLYDKNYHIVGFYY